MKKNYKTPVALLLVMTTLLGFYAILPEAEAKTLQQEIPNVIEVSHQEAVEAMEVKEQALAITDDERDLIERIIMAEARGESLECMMACAQVIRDRCFTRNQTPTEVCTAPYQFCKPYKSPATDRVKDAVAFVFDKGESPLEYPTTHFYASHLIDAPSWTESKTYRGTIDGVSFYY